MSQPFTLVEKLQLNVDHIKNASTYTVQESTTWLGYNETTPKIKYTTTFFGFENDEMSPHYDYFKFNINDIVNENPDADNIIFSVFNSGSTYYEGSSGNMLSVSFVKDSETNKFMKTTTVEGENFQIKNLQTLSEDGVMYFDYTWDSKDVQFVLFIPPSLSASANTYDTMAVQYVTSFENDKLYNKKYIEDNFQRKIEKEYNDVISVNGNRANENGEIIINVNAGGSSIVSDITSYFESVDGIKSFSATLTKTKDNAFDSDVVEIKGVLIDEASGATIRMEDPSYASKQNMNFNVLNNDLTISTITVTSADTNTGSTITIPNGVPHFNIWYPKFENNVNGDSYLVVLDKANNNIILPSNVKTRIVPISQKKTPLDNFCKNMNASDDIKYPNRIGYASQKLTVDDGEAISMRYIREIHFGSDYRYDPMIVLPTNFIREKGWDEICSMKVIDLNGLSSVVTALWVGTENYAWQNWSFYMGGMTSLRFVAPGFCARAINICTLQHFYIGSLDTSRWECVNTAGTLSVWNTGGTASFFPVQASNSAELQWGSNKTKYFGYFDWVKDNLNNANGKNVWLHCDSLEQGEWFIYNRCCCSSDVWKNTDREYTDVGNVKLQYENGYIGIDTSTGGF
jgi:hypothetical protein